MKYLEKIIEYSLYLFVFLLPWQTRWIWHWGELNGGVWEYGTFSLYATEIILIIVSLFYCFIVIRSSEVRLRAKKLLVTGYWLLVTLLIISALTIFWSADKSLALYAWFKLLEGIILFWLVLNIKFSRVKLAWTFVSAAVIQSILGIWQFLTQSTFASKWLGMAYHHAGQAGSFVIETSDGRWLRAYGSLPHPNILAGFLVVAILILLRLWLTEKDRELKYWKKILLAAGYWLLVTLLITCLFFTFSRSAWLAFIIVILSYCYIVIRSSEAKLRVDAELRSATPKFFLFQFLATGAIIILLLTTIYWPLVSTRLGLAERLEIKSTQERMVGYQESWQLIKNNWYKGVGVGNYTLAIRDQVNPNLSSWSYQPVHNIYILILSELGVIGFLIFMVFVYILVRSTLLSGARMHNLAPVRRLEPTDLLVTSIYGISLPALLIIGLFDHYLWSLHSGILLFWLIFGLCSQRDNCG